MEGRTNYNYGTGRILELKDVNYMNKIVDSDLSDEEKAIKLHSFCSERCLKNSLSACKVYGLPYSEKIIKLIEIYEDYKARGLFDIFKRNYKCTLEEIELRIKKINDFYKAVISEDNDYNKAVKLLSLFKNSEEFRRSYALFVKYGQDDERLDPAREALDNFEMLYDKFKEYEDKGIIDFVKYVINVQAYADNYDYAKFAVDYYIQSSESYKTSKFLKKLGIDEDTFKFCVDAIKELDVDLYKQYLAKKESNNKTRCIRNTETIVDLANGINYGLLADGTKFDLLEFIKRVPFKRSKDFISKLIEFMRSNNKREMATILRYIRANGLDRANTFAPLTVEDIYKTKYILKGIELSKEDKDIIIDYIKVNKLPLINKVFSLVRNKYLNGEINAEMVEKQKEQLEAGKEVEATLIPSKK